MSKVKKKLVSFMVAMYKPGDHVYYRDTRRKVQGPYRVLDSSVSSSTSPPLYRLEGLQELVPENSLLMSEDPPKITTGHQQQDISPSAPAKDGPGSDSATPALRHSAEPVKRSPTASDGYTGGMSDGSEIRGWNVSVDEISKEEQPDLSGTRAETYDLDIKDAMSHNSEASAISQDFVANLSKQPVGQHRHPPSSSASSISDQAPSVLSLETVDSRQTNDTLLSEVSGYSKEEINSATEQLIILLSQDEVLKPAIRVAVSKRSIGPERFERNFRRFLVMYSNQLSSEAISNEQRLGVGLVYRKAALIAETIRLIFNPDQESGDIGGSDVESLTEEGPLLVPEPDEKQEPQSLDPIQSFLLNGRPYKNLQIKFREWAFRSTILQQVSDALKGSNDDHIPVEITIQWQLPLYMRDGLETPRNLETVLVITGESNKAYASSCLDYVEFMWGEKGVSLLQVIIELFEMMPIRRDTVYDYSIRGTSLRCSQFESAEAKFESSKQDAPLVCETLAWLAAACRPPQERTLQASEVIFENHRRTGPLDFQITTQPLSPLREGDGCCWHRMFEGYVLAKGFPVPGREHAQGLELPLGIMAHQAMTFHPIEYKEGLILKGSHTALVPLATREGKSIDQVQEVQWHFIGNRPRIVEIDFADENTRTDECYLNDKTLAASVSPISWEDIDKHCRNILLADSLDSLAGKRTFVGAFPFAQNHLGTKGSGYDIIERSGASDVPGGISFELEKAINFGLTSNFATGGVIGMSATTKISYSKFDPIIDLPKTIISDKLRTSKHKPQLLYDVEMKSAWLVPETSVVLHLMLSWASVQSLPLGFEQQKVLNFMPFAEASRDGGEAAAREIHRKAHEELPGDIRRIDKPERLVTVWQIALMMFLVLDALKENQQRLRRKLDSWGSYLNGYEFVDIVNRDKTKARRVHIDKAKSGGWIELVQQIPDVVVLFGNKFGEPLRYEPRQQVCHCWTRPPKHNYFLTADSEVLRYLSETCEKCEHFRVTNKLFLSKGSGARRRHEREQCKGEKWPCCNIALQLKSHPPKTATVKIEPGEAVVIGNALPRLLNSKQTPKDDSLAVEGEVNALTQEPGKLETSSKCMSKTNFREHGTGNYHRSGEPSNEHQEMFGSEDEDLGMDKSHYYSLTSHSKPDKGKNRKFELDTDSVSEGAEEAFFNARTEWEEEVTGRWNDMST